jgi:hypothetical protein
MNYSRREFISLATTAAIAPRWLTQQQPVHAVIIYSDPFKDTLRGALVGCDEAERAAVLLRRRFQHSLVHINNLNTEALRGATHIVVATDNAIEISAGTLVLDAARSGDAPGQHCQQNRWYVPPLLRHQQLALEAQSDPKQASAWHHQLERFGAGQLNARFVAAGIENPDGQHWCGWMAIKCIWESSLRNQPMPELSFDGHKGRRLFFGAQSRNLIQPIYVVRGDKVIFEWNPPEDIQDVPCASS